MTENGKAQIEAVGAGLIGFVVVVGAGALFMFSRGGSAVKAPPSSYAPVNSISGLSAPEHSALPARSGAPMGEAGAVASSPAPLLPAPLLPAGARDAAAPAAAPAPSAAAPADAGRSAFARKLVVTTHLDGSSSAHSSAKATVASAPAASAKPKPIVPKKAFVTPKLDLTNVPSLAATVHYGVSGRSELMGRAAGPVYNFSGRNAAKGQAPAPGVSGALSKVEAAQQQVDDSPLTDSDKAAINANLGKVRQAVVDGAAK